MIDVIMPDETAISQSPMIKENKIRCGKTLNMKSKIQKEVGSF
jgi:hypothetical protein